MKSPIDLFSYAGSQYLVLVDRFSGFPLVKKLKSLTSSAICSHLLSWFHDFGFPFVLRSDGGPQFRSDFSAFCKRHDIRHETSSAYFPQSNGLAENAVKSTKRLLRKCDGNWPLFCQALLHWRNMPRADGYSPAQFFFGHQQFFGQPLLSFPTFIDRKLAHERRQRLLTDPIHRCFDSSAHDLPPLPIGSAVVAQNPKTNLWDLHATIISSLSDGRSYLIVDDSGRESKRNRRHLRADLAN